MLSTVQLKRVPPRAILRLLADTAEPSEGEDLRVTKPTPNNLLLAIAASALALATLLTACNSSVDYAEVLYTPETPGIAQVGQSGRASSRGSPAGNICPSLGGIDLLANGPWLQEMKRDIRNDLKDVDSDHI